MTSQLWSLLFKPYPADVFLLFNQQVTERFGEAASGFLEREPSFPEGATEEQKDVIFAVTCLLLNVMRRFLSPGAKTDFVARTAHDAACAELVRMFETCVSTVRKHCGTTRQIQRRKVK